VCYIWLFSDTDKWIQITNDGVVTLITCTKHHYKSHTGVLADQMCYELSKGVVEMFIMGVQRGVLGMFLSHSHGC